MPLNMKVYKYTLMKSKRPWTRQIPMTATTESTKDIT